MTKPYFEDSDPTSEIAHEPISVQAGRAGLHLARPEDMYSSDRELHPDEEEILDEFSPRRKAVVEWLLRHTDVPTKAGKLISLIDSDNPGNARQIFHYTRQQIQDHHLIGPYARHSGIGRGRAYWIDSDWRQAEPTLPEIPTIVATKLQRSDTISIFPSHTFETALQNGNAQVAPLSKEGLQLVWFGDQEHIFLKGAYVPMPKDAVHILQILALHPEGLDEEGVNRQLNDYIEIELKEVSTHLAYLRNQLAGADCLEVKADEAQTAVYRIKGAFSREEQD